MIKHLFITNPIFNLSQYRSSTALSSTYLFLPPTRPNLIKPIPISKLKNIPQTRTPHNQMSPDHRKPSSYYTEPAQELSLISILSIFRMSYLNRRKSLQHIGHHLWLTASSPSSMFFFNPGNPASNSFFS